MSIPIIQTDTDIGKEFIGKIKTLRDTLFPGEYGEKTRQFIKLSPEQLENNQFILDIFKSLSSEDSKLFEALNIKNVSIGNYSRKGGSSYKPSKSVYFRILLHVGDPEVYYLDSDTMKDNSIPVLNGEGIMIPNSTNTYITVYPNPRRILYDQNKQDKISKIRPRNYNRITVLYDFEIDVDFLDKQRNVQSPN